MSDKAKKMAREHILTYDADEWLKFQYSYNEMVETYLAGYESRQPEIDSLKKQLGEALIHLDKTISESNGSFDTANAYEFLQKMKVKNE